MFKITSIKTKKLDIESETLKGVARIEIDNCFSINDIRIIKSKKRDGYFVAFPSRVQKDGTHKDVCHPLNAETRKYFEEEIISNFEKLENQNDEI